MRANRLSQQLRIFGRWFFVFAMLVSLVASVSLVQPTRAASPLFVNVSAPPGGDGLTWATAFNDLQLAIETSVSGEEIWVVAGTYTPQYPLRPEDPRSASFFPKDGVAIYGGFIGTETQRDQRNWVNNVTILNGHVTPAVGDPYQVYHVVYNENLPSAGTRLDGFTITGGRADGVAVDAGGGGIRLAYANATLANLIVVDNYAANDGGGINASYSPLIVENVKFQNNSAYIGGGFYNHQGIGVEVNNSTFEGNLSTYHGGGYFDFEAVSTLRNNTFVNNTSYEGGGGIFNFFSTTSIFDNIFTTNYAGRVEGGVITGYGAGGAIGINSDQPAWIQDCVFQSNEASLNGGAVSQARTPAVWYRNTFIDNYAVGHGGAFHTERSAPWIGNSLFLANASASMGGALNLDQSSTGVVTNSVFNGNHATQGGAIRIHGPSSTPTLTNLTITQNSVGGDVPKGSGIFQMAASDDLTNSTVVNSIIFGNTGADQIHLLDARMDLSNSIVTSYFLEASGTVLGGTGIITANPLFIDPNGADNIAGTSDDDFRIPSNSPAVDVGIPGDLDTQDVDDDDNVTEPYPFHMGTGPRIVDLQNAPIAAPSPIPAVDLGAYEAQSPVLTVVKATSGTLYEGAAFPVTVTVTNTGLGMANDVVVSDTLPAGLTIIPGSVTRTMGVAGTLPVLAQGFDLQPSQSMVVSFNATMADGPASITNTARATAYEIITPAEGSTLMVINNLPPGSVTVTPPVGTIYEGNSAQYSGTFVDPAGALDAPFTALWNFGDATAPVEGGTTQSHTYRDSGTYSIILRVTDADGGEGFSAPTPVSITNLPPQVSLNPVGPGIEGTPITFTGSFTDAAQALDVPYSYTWRLDATTVIGTGTVTSYNPASPPIVTAQEDMGPGSHTVTLTVTDKDGGSTSLTSAPFTVTDVAPEVTITATGSAVEGAPYTLQAQVVDPGIEYGETFTYSWNFGSGPVAGSAVQSHVFPDNGIYNVTVTVQGSHGGSDTSPVYPVTVSNAVPVASIQPVGAAVEGLSITFTGGFTDPGQANDINYTYEWVLDGTTIIGTGTVSSYNPAIPPVVTANEDMGSGQHTVTLKVTDKDGGESVLASAVFTVGNVAPSPSVSATGSAFEGAPFTLTGSFTDPGELYGETYTYSWNFGDGTAPVTGTLTPSHTYADSGTYQVVLTVTDSDSASTASAPFPVVVGNVTPTPSIQPVVGAIEGSLYTFSGSFTDPAQALDLNYVYVWRLDGIVIGSGTVTSYTPGTPPVVTASEAMSTGSHTVSLQVTDGDNGTNTVTRDFTVANQNPVVDVTAIGVAYDGLPASFGVAYTDPGQAYGETYTIQWSFGDGTIINNGDATEEHAFGTTGSHTITVTVTDGHGGVGTDSVTITVLNAVPTATIGQITGSRVEGSTLTFNGSGTDPSPTGSIATYAWDFGDGSTGSGAQTTHIYRDNGTYTITLTVTDDDGATDTETAVVVIMNALPVADAGASVFGKTGQMLQFQGSFTDAGLDDTHTIHWDFGDGTSTNGLLNPTHAYAEAGTYTVTLTVTDKDGGEDTDSTFANIDRYKILIPVIIKNAP